MATSRASKRTPKILVVDDDPGLLRLLTIRLRSQKYEVEPAENAAKALSVIARFRPDLVHHRPAHGRDGRHRAAARAAAPLARPQRHHADRARHDSRCRQGHAVGRVRVPDQAGREGTTARGSAPRAQDLGLRRHRRGLAHRVRHPQPAGRGPAGQGAPGRGHGFVGADHRRARHRQGTAGAGDPPGQRPPRGAVRVASTAARWTAAPSTWPPASRNWRAASSRPPAARSSCATSTTSP